MKFAKDKDFKPRVLAGIRAVAKETGMSGASLHCATLGYDDGGHYIVTGPGIHREYRSAAAAWGSYHAAWKSYSIWRVNSNGSRTLVFR